MKNKLFKTLAGVALLICLFFVNTVFVLAEDLPVSVKPILPDNQIDKNASYYDLKVKPGQTQDLELTVYNSSDNEVTLNVAVNPAFTSMTGTFIYSLNSKDKDESLKTSLTEMTTTDPTISIPAKGETSVKVKLNVPKDPFSGLILGAVRITGAPNDKADKKESDKQGFSVDNKFAYSIAVQLREDEKLPKSDMKLKKFSASQVVGRNSVKVNLQNPTPTIINALSYDASITEKGKSEVLHKNKVKDFRFAPNTSFDFPIDWENQAFKAGEYSLHMKVRLEESNQDWTFDQDFTISAKEAKELNEKAVDLEKNYMLWIIIGMVSLLLIIIVLLIVIIFIKKNNSKKKRAKALEAKRRKKKSKSNNSRNKERSANESTKARRKKHKN